MGFGKLGGTIEGLVEHVTAKSTLVQDTVDGVKYFIPHKCVLERSEPDENGNILFEVNEWWWDKKDDFIAS